LIYNTTFVADFA